ncbi:LysR family transcriptional regulator [Pseudoalteromonas denitrificans]|uniref:DNA-binding transcriptional regulator, LysR family n=1 Tax=Pseudoalteromonas denitrificans DSM 6059 TaxID=1123010 RepID=A0A1I1NZI4_9GAMM|nr:LysR family transcriptional regulator [Pseudoalteromonas denitrificans]SFC99100.1 DNA-binding transcriptional regulator, LysR family [Pseudoalteromonas denitrificans DSM 6059]
MDKLKAINYFKRVVELQSFTAAANEFNVPASSISRRIKDLETQLGIELVERSTRNVKVSGLGRLYYQRITEVIDKLNSADALVSQNLSRPSGKLRISAPPGLAEVLLIPIFESFRKQYPEILLDLDFSDQLVMFGKDEVDIAIRGAPLKDERLIAKKLSSDPYQLWGAKNLVARLHSQFKTDTLTAKQLEECPALMFRTSNGFSPWFIKTTKWEKLSMRPTFICNSRTALMDALKNEEGLLISPKWLLPKELSTQIYAVNTQGVISASQQENMEVHLLYQQSKIQLPSIRVCVDFIQNEVVKYLKV